jgi:hypothetical protein
MRSSAALLARRLAGASPSLLSAGLAQATGSVSAGMAVAAATTATLGAARSFTHAAPLSFAAQPAAASTSGSGPLNARAECGDVPEGHRETDLSHHVNNIGLGRRRDLTLRADVKLTGPDNATGQSLAALLKVSLWKSWVAAETRRGTQAK